MTQIRLKRLLEEAASQTCSAERHNAIICQLLDEAPGDLSRIEGEEAGIRLVLNCLWESTVQNRPDLLPSLFPAFAIMCGERKESVMIAHIDWSLI